VLDEVNGIDRFEGDSRAVGCERGGGGYFAWGRCLKIVWKFFLGAIVGVWVGGLFVGAPV